MDIKVCNVIVREIKSYFIVDCMEEFNGFGICEERLIITSLEEVYVCFSGGVNDCI